MAIVKVSKKGWVVIPHDIRKRYGLRPGDMVYITDYGGRIAIVPALKGPIRELHGMFKGGPSMTEGLLDDRRWEREREEEKIEKEFEKKAKAVVKKEMQNRKQYDLGDVKVEVVRPFHNKFCKYCRRLRVTSDGKIKTCLLRNDNLIDFTNKESFLEAIKIKEA